MEKYLIVGTGGVGGSIAGFLALAGKDERALPVASIWKPFVKKDFT